MISEDKDNLLKDILIITTEIRKHLSDTGCIHCKAIVEKALSDYSTEQLGDSE
jgi:hypothetical protein